MNQPLAGKHALVTGGGTGIGLAIAKALAENGALVTITGRRLDVLEDAAKTQDGIFAMQMDVADENSVVTGIQKAVQERGPIAITIANAGVAEGRGALKTDLEFWRWMMSINLDGVFLTMREALKTLGQGDWGRVIAISSIAGLKGLRGAPAYSASKHGVIGLVRAFSEEFMGSNITFNALCPAYVDTPIVSDNVDKITKRAGVNEEEAMNMMVKMNRHKRLIAPEEIASAALWLCLPGSESVNGQTIEIAGGQM